MAEPNAERTKSGAGSYRNGPNGPVIKYGNGSNGAICTCMYCNDYNDDNFSISRCINSLLSVVLLNYDYYYYYYYKRNMGNIPLR